MASVLMYSTQLRKQLLILSLVVFACITRSFAQNEIVTENLLTGNPSSEWDISGAGDLTIQGFATDMSVNKGSTIHFKINTDAVSYTINIYRLGYYQGNGARLITSLGSFTGTVQPSPNTNAGTGIVDCSNWSESASWAVPSAAVSGVYIAKLTRTDNNGSSHIPFVVRDDAGNSDLLFKTSDATWQAYNVYGGNSLYVGSTSYSGGHAVKVSYNRPFITRAGGGGGGVMEDMVFNAEYPMIRFLERNGYDVSYTTDVDMDRDVTPITPSIHKVLLSVGHDEYWSANERAKFEAARNAGVHLAFFSGNEVYWKTRWEDNHRTLVCYKEGTLGENVCNGECDPEPEWTGLWRDGCTAVNGTGGCNPENALTGQISWFESSQPITVPDTYKNFRFWRNTSVALLGSGQTETMTDGTLGYEWDYEQYASSYPVGRITLSSTIVGDKTHKLSLYRHSSGALVFGAGTVQWSWGLDDNHDRGNAAPSQSMQQATVNLLADMGVQPATLMAGLVAATASTDITAPAPVITFPAHNGSVQANTPVNVTGTASDAGGVIAGIEISFDGGVNWLPVTGTTNWSYSWIPTVAGTYSIRVRGFDDSGNMGVPGAAGTSDHITVNVTTGLPGASSIFQPTDVPAIPLTNDNNGNGIEVGVKFRVTQLGYINGIRYYKGAGATGTHIGQLWTGTGNLLAEATFINETASGWQEVLFNTPVSVSPNITYVAAYFSSSGDYAVTNPYFTSAVVNGPLRALANGEDGPNGVFKITSVPSFPNAFYQSGNYWVDVVFTPNNNPDTDPPAIAAALPAKGSSLVPANTAVSVIFNEDVDISTITASSFELRDAGNSLVPSTVSYLASARMARLVPSLPLAYSSSYTALIKGGALGVKDLAGNPLTADSAWSFTTVSGPLQNPLDGPGGPVLVISSAANPFSRYAVEILRAEGLNHFATSDISAVNATLLNNYDVVILGEMTVDAAQVTLLTDWVNAGGTLIAFKPSALLTPLMGLSPAGGTLSDKYLLVNTASGPGTGIVNQTIQYHGEASLHTLNGATIIATLYSDASTATSNPAVTTINVGVNGGKAIAFTYDLARSIVYTRQGNPAWAGQKRDGTPGPKRSDDLFYPDWVDFNKIAIPQADEQQRLLANIILQSNLHRKPLPRFWYLPRDLKAAIVMTGDDHDNNGTIGRFNQYLTLGPNTLQDIENWTAIRGTSYVYPTTPITNAEAAAMEAKGFEISLHASTGCADFTTSSILIDITNEKTDLLSNLPGISSPATGRTHCLPWSDWASQPKAELQNGIRLDVNYYYWPEAWILNRPGMFTGSGIPMRFADIDGSLIDVYQAPTQMTDESGIGIADFTNAVLDKAIGPEGYYGVFVANMHTDTANHTGSNAIIASALARNIPVISAKQMLTWLDGRNNSYFGTMTWNGTVLSFPITAYSGSNNLRAMLPLYSQDGQLVTVSVNGSPLSLTNQTIKGIQYVFFDVVAGTNTYVATYSNDHTPPVISNIAVTTNATGTATITWNTDEPTDTRVDYGTATGSLTESAADLALVTSHSITLTGLAPVTTYYFRVTSKDLMANSSTSPVPAIDPLSFVMPAFPCVNDQTVADFSQGSTDPNTMIVNEVNGDVILQAALDQEFPDTAVPAGWGSATYSGSGSVVVNNGTVTVSGARVFSANSYGPGTVLDFIATFNLGSFQMAGFTTDQAFNASPWVTIGQGSADGNLYVRASDGTNINLGSSLLGAAHRYIIQWNANNFEFYIDGNTTPAATLNLPVVSAMYIQASDFPASEGALTVDRIRVIPYAASGTFTSRVFDAGTVKPWGAITWSSSIPPGTGIAMSVRTGNTSTPDGTWSEFLPITASGNTVGASSRYIQYRAEMTTSDTKFTPVLRDVVIECSSPPLITAHPSAATVCDNTSVTFTTGAGGFPAPTIQWQVSGNGTDWTDINGATGTTLTFTATVADNNKQYRAVWTNTVSVVNSNAALLTVNPIPVAPVVTVVNNCASSELTATGFTGTLLWSNSATTASITVNDAALYTVTQTVSGCVSPAGSGTSAPKPIPAAPAVTVVNNCGSSELTASGFTGALLWSNGATTASIAVTDAATYTVTQTVEGCISPNGSGVSAPKAIPAAPVVTVVNNCGNSELTASGFTGALLWSNGAATASIAVTDAATYTVTQTVEGCISPNGSGVSAPKIIPAAPVVTVVNNCGSSELTASGFTGALLWSNGATTASIAVTDAATYTVTQTVEGCVSPNGSGVSAPKIIPAAPTVTVVNNCGNSVLTASNFTGTLLWSNLATTPSITVTGAGTYTVKQTVDGCVSANGSGVAAPAVIPAVPRIVTVNNCGNSTLTASNYTGTLLWNTGETTPVITVSTPGIYTVTQTVNGCTSPRIETRGGRATPKPVPPSPVVSVTDNCGNSVLTASAYTGTLLWNTGASVPAITVSTAGTYSVTQTGANGCVSAPAPGIATPKEIPAAPIITAGGPTIFCDGGSVVLTSSEATGNNWSTGASTQSVTIGTSGNYTATYTAPNGCTSPVSTPLTVTVKSHSASTTNVTVCSAELPYVWNGNNYNATGAYNVTLVNAAGCDSVATLNLTVNITPAPPAITAGGPVTFCQGSFVTLSSNRVTGNNWSTGATTQSIVVAASGNYSATYTAPNGCTSAPSIPVTVTVTTSSVSTTNATTCSSQLPYVWNGNNYNASGVYNVVLTNQSGCDSIAILILEVIPSTSSTTNVTRCSNQLPYSWNGVDYTVSGVYTVTGLVNAAGCDSTATLVFTVNQTTSSTTNVTRCSNQLPYTWNGVDYTVSGVYTVTGLVNAAGCDSTATLVFTVNPTTNSTTDVTVCTNQLPYVWNGNNYNVTGTYSVTLINAAGCDSVATLNLTVNESPTAGITNNSAATVLTCTQTSISVTATGGVSYSWSDGTTTVGTTENLTITAAGTYTVTVTGANGCTSTASITITQDVTVPTAGITNNSAATVLTCTQTSISVTATGGVSYSWSDGTTTVGTTENLTITAAGTYTVTVTGANGCTSTASIVITQNTDVPTAGITNNSAATVLTCTQTSISVTATGGVSYSWSDGTTVVGTSDALIITAPGTYTVTVTGANGCTSTANIVITQNTDVPTAGITNNSAATVLTCTQTSVSVTATGGVSYSWSDGTTVVGTSDALIITAPGTYTVTVTGANGCTSTANIVITQDVTVPTAGITNNSAATVLTCTQTSISVTATGGVSYSWSDGTTTVGTTENLTITAPGTYTVTVTGANGCTSTANIVITQDVTVPTAGITNNSAATVLTCTQTSISVTATGGVSYSWSDGTTTVGTTENLTITAAGTYTVTVTGANGCTSTANIVITQDVTVPTAGITNNSAATVLTCTQTSISVTATGGVSYSWSDGTTTVGTTENLTITAAGTYTVTVTGANGCTSTASIVITQNTDVPTAGITNNSAATVLTCTQTSISVTATGGVSYSWSDGTTTVGTTENLTITAAGTYTVTVTGTNGCTSTASITITQDVTVPTAGITNNSAATVLTCTQTSISVTATGGVSYSWSDGTTTVGTTENLTITAAGTYTVTVTGANGCTSTASIVITQNTDVPTAGITNNSAATVLTCTQTSISVTATGGVSYSWSDGTTTVGTTENLTITAPGTYTVTVTGANGCTSTASITITQDVTVPTAGITNNSAATVLTCTQTSISVTATGGVSYSWSDGTTTVGTTENLTITAAGTYTVTVTGANGCTSTASITITQDVTVPTAAITNNSAATVLTCTQTSISVTATGGVSYSWSDGTTTVGTTENLTITAAGTYTVTVTGANGCTSTASITITQDVTVPTAGITNNSAATVLTCTQTSISVTATGGVSYSWSDGTTVVGTSDALIITAPGTYTVTVTGANGCTSTANIVITQNTDVPTAGITNNSAATVLTCTQTSISVTATGGVSYSWSDGTTTVGTTENLTITAAGTYTVTVTGANGCTSTASITITQDVTVPTAGITNNSAATVLTCTQTSISVTATGGVSYSWSDGTTVVGTTENLTITAAGTYTVTVTGANGCTSTANIVITQDVTVPTAGITNNSAATVLTCTQTSISVTATGGVSYSWSDGTTTVGTTENLTITAAGTYTVTVTGANGCTSTASIVITQDVTVPTAGITNNSAATVLTCTQTSISVTATGGVSYSWSDGTTVVGTSDALIITAPGIYTVTVTGANGCTSTASIVITQNTDVPTAGITNNSAATVLTCTQTSVSVTATGGVSYSWSDGTTTVGTTENLTITAAGTYTVTVTGANGCTSTASIVITQNTDVPTAGITNNSAATVLTCTQTSISVTATGGVSYSWSDGTTTVGTTENLTITAPGTYTVTVTGANGCTSTANIVITQDVTVPTAGITNNSAATVLTCTQTSISVTATGGVSYSWSDGTTTVGTTENLTITAAGTYTVTVTGANGCTSTASIVITQNTDVPTAGITNNSAATVLTCTQTSISVTATGGVSYSWSDGTTTVGTTENLTITAAGTYTVTVTGTNGCTSTASITITQDVTVPTAGITNNSAATVLTCTQTSISVTATGGVSYSWSDGTTTVGTTENLTITAAGTYTVTVTGANGCTSTASIVITQNTDVPTAGITNNSAATVLTCTQTSISVTATGGVSYSWSDGTTTVGTTENLTITAPGTYTVTVTGANGCTSTASITITQDVTVPTAGITNNSAATVLTCTQTSISVTATGGVSYSWSDGTTTVGTTENLTITAAGTYTVTVTGANGCTSTASITITQDVTVPTAAITNNSAATVLTCTQTSISVTATGGVSYSWSDGTTTVGTTENLTITAAGTYTVTVTGANGCTSTASITITQDVTVPTAGITNNSAATVLTCTQTSISVTATGGVSYSWSDGTTTVGTTENLTITAAGTYTVTVTGANGCTSTASIVITQNTDVPTAGITNNSAATVLTCTQTSISVTATGGVSYSWSDGTTTVGTTENLTITAPGTYTVTVTGANGCTSTANIVITQDVTVPTAGITNNSAATVLTCTQTSISVTATGGVSYSWSDGTTVVGTSDALIITAPGTYTVTVTGANGCTSTASIVITQNTDVPTAGITNNSAATVLTCTQTSISVTATGGVSYSWSDGTTVVGTSDALIITAPGTYTVTVTGANGCTSTANIVITQDVTVPTAGITNNSAATVLTCTQTSISVTATGGVSYSWSDGTTVVGTSDALIITAPGTYTVTVTGANGCTSTASIVITQNTDVPTAGITNNSAATVLTCTQTSVSVTATGGVSYSWSDGTTTVGTTENLTITAAGTYTVTVTGANGCTSTASITITQDVTVPTAGITNNSAATVLTCTQTSISVTATGGVSYSWSDGTTTVGTTENLTITAPGTYTVTVTGANGCTSTANIVITQDVTVPTAGITNNSAATVLTCTQTSISVTATGGVSYSWSDGTTTVGTTENLTITAPGTYTVTVTGANGCTSTASITITQDVTVPTAGITNNSAATVLTCTQTSISVTATGGVSYSWSDGTTVVGTSDALIITAPGTYTVTVTGANGCTSTANIVITQDVTVPTAAITNNSAATVLTCTQTSVSVTATGGVSYSWSDGTTVVGISDALIITAPGTYTVTVTGANGCTSTASITITQDVTVPTAGITNNSAATVLTCTQTSISVTATGGVSYSWSDGTTTVGTTENLTITAPGTYTVTVTGANGCTSTASITITQDVTVPTAGITNNSAATVLTCTQTSVSVTATGGVSYSWSDGTTVVGTSDALIITAPGTYTVTVTGANGCTSTASIVITQDVTAPTITGTTPGSSCGTGTVVLGAAASAGTINWYAAATGGTSLGTGTSFTTPTLSTTTSYWVDATGANGCVTANRTEVIATVNPIPAAPSIAVSEGFPDICVPNTVILAADPNTGIQWYRNSVLLAGETLANIETTVAGNYSATYTLNGCESPQSNVITVTVSSGPPAVDPITGNTAITTGGTSQLADATPGGVWSSANTAIATVDANGLVTGVAAGNTTINYAVTNGCGTTTVSVGVTVTAPGGRIVPVTSNALAGLAGSTLTVTAMPNTTTDYFNLVIRSKEDGAIAVRIHDMYGTIVETHARIAPGTTLRVGAGWSAGIYFAEVLQGNAKKVVRLIKTN